MSEDTTTQPPEAIGPSEVRHIIIHPDLDWPGRDPLHLADYTVASSASVETMLDPELPTDGGGRSAWMWVRLPDGTLIFGCFPQGVTYFATEEDHRC